VLTLVIIPGFFSFAVHRKILQAVGSEGDFPAGIPEHARIQPVSKLYFKHV
jgi:hypothetical protein